VFRNEGEGKQMSTETEHPTPGPSAPAESQVWHVGAVKVTRIIEQVVGLPLTFLFPQATAEVTAGHLWLQPEFMDEDGQGLLSVHSYVLETAGRRIIVDTCYGNDKIRTLFPQGHDLHLPFLRDLTAAGYPPETIDTVLCTHLHGDHVGWNTQLVEGEWTPTFPSARYLFNQAEYDHWSRVAGTPEPSFAQEQSQVFADSVAPVAAAGLAGYVTGRHQVTPEITLEPSPGHSPGHACVRIQSEGQEAWIIGDVAHHPVQLAHPDWGFSDDSAEEALATRLALFNRFADQPVLVFGSHWAGRNAVYLTREGNAFRVHDLEHENQLLSTGLAEDHPTAAAEIHPPPAAITQRPTTKARRHP
jgi:glyoxylase-like metal-dependent hydrolase (beta-lactamase superfamily II)